MSLALLEVTCAWHYILFALVDLAEVEANYIFFFVFALTIILFLQPMYLFRCNKISCKTIPYSFLYMSIFILLMIGK